MGVWNKKRWCKIKNREKNSQPFILSLPTFWKIISTNIFMEIAWQMVILMEGELLWFYLFSLCQPLEKVEPNLFSLCQPFERLFQPIFLWKLLDKW